MRAFVFATVMLAAVALAAVAAAGPVVDTSTQGDWVGVYGTDGYVLPSYLGGGDAVALPDYVSSHVLTGSRWTWSASTSDPRAVADPTNPAVRKAACAYDGASLGLTVDLKRPVAMTLGLYLLDWDSTTREQRVTVSGHAPADAAGYHDGHWYRFVVSGDATSPVTAQLSRLAGANAVVSAVTFDPLLHVHQFLGSDSTTQGNWVDAAGNHIYGNDGYILPAFLGGANTNSSDLTDLPDVVESYSFTTPGGGRYQWAVNTSDDRALLDPGDPSNDATRRATCAFGGNDLGFELEVTRPVEFDLSLYLLDWDRRGRGETIQMPSALGIDDIPATGFENGRWYVYHVYADPDSPLTIAFPRTLGPNTVLSGIAFDDLTFVPEPASVTLLALGGLGLAMRRRRP